MITVSIIFVIVVLLAYLDGRGMLKKGLEWSLILLVVFFSFRVNYGNDYLSYLNIYNLINKASSFSSCDVDVEFGWKFINYYCSFLGFHFVLFLHLCVLVYSFYYVTKKYIPKEYYWLSVFILCFNPSLFLLDLSMMRQSMAISFFILAIFTAYEKKNIQPALFVVLAIMFHHTAIIIIPVVILVRFAPNINTLYIILAGLVLFYLLWTNRNLLVEYTSYIMTLGDLSEEYGSYKEEGELGSGYGVFLQFLFLLPAVFYSKKLVSLDNKLISLYLINFMFIPFSTIMVMLGRLSSYFLVYVVFLVPILLGKCKKNIIYYFTLLCVIVYCLYSYYAFFYSATYGAAFSNYHSLLF